MVSKAGREKIIGKGCTISTTCMYYTQSNDCHVPLSIGLSVLYTYRHQRAIERENSASLVLKWLSKNKTTNTKFHPSVLSGWSAVTNVCYNFTQEQQQQQKTRKIWNCFALWLWCVTIDFFCTQKTTKTLSFNQIDFNVNSHEQHVHSCVIMIYFSNLILLFWFIQLDFSEIIKKFTNQITNK